MSIVSWSEVGIKIANSNEVTVVQVETALTVHLVRPHLRIF